MPAARAHRRVFPTIALAALVFGTSGSVDAGPGPDSDPLFGPATHADTADDSLVEFHFSPVPNAQIAIWLEDADGNFLRDVFVTQATGRLGIGNRSGIWNFPSSWRAPYGPRKNVLPIWGHRRGTVYPKIVFHDPAENHSTSLGFHEATSSAEPYHCRPLTPDENMGILDSMTCPSPAVFKTDKGRFEGTETSVYPPRNDIAEWNEFRDHENVQSYGELNDLDAVTGATPAGNDDTFVSILLSEAEVAQGPLTAWIEINTEADENGSFNFDREDDHFIDPLLSAYGIEFLGQPSVVYSVEFDPAAQGLWSTSSYRGYSDWDGASGTLYEPDDSISDTPGSGAGRLQDMSAFGEDFRFGVFTGMEGQCTSMTLPPVEDLAMAPTDFDRVEAVFTIPDLPEGTEITRIVVKQVRGSEDFQEEAAVDASGIPTICDGSVGDAEQECVEANPGDTISILIPQLHENHDYAFAVGYEDRCANNSEFTTDTARTPAQEFAVIDSLCFVATAAYGAGWAQEVKALRMFRDRYLKTHAFGMAAVKMYYAYGPHLARPLKRSPALRAYVRHLLYPVVLVAKGFTADQSQLWKQ